MQLHCSNTLFKYLRQCSAELNQSVLEKDGIAEFVKTTISYSMVLGNYWWTAWPFTRRKGIITTGPKKVLQNRLIK